MRIKVETNDEGFAIGKCPLFSELVAGGGPCNFLCRYHGETDFKNKTFECRTDELFQRFDIATPKKGNWNYENRTD